jgi:hypothetical protein
MKLQGLHDDGADREPHMPPRIPGFMIRLFTAGAVFMWALLFVSWWLR